MVVAASRLSFYAFGKRLMREGFWIQMTASLLPQRLVRRGRGKYSRGDNAGAAHGDWCDQLEEDGSRITSISEQQWRDKMTGLLQSGAKKPTEIDHQFYEFGSVQYRIQVSISEPHLVYLSVTTSLQSQGVPPADVLPHHALHALKRVYSDVVEVVEPSKEGYQLTLRINIAKLPQRKEDCIRIITEISSVQAVILSSQLKEMLWHLSPDNSQMMFKPIKLVYHPREPFFIIRLPEKITAIFPMRFQDNSDVIIATTLFQELMYMGCLGSCAEAPPCTWSPIPPAELRGEPLEDLSTNGGFVSFDIFSRHIEGSKLDRTVWNLLNFYAFVKYHVKCTRGFIQRRMRKRMESLSEVLQKARITSDGGFIDGEAPRNRCLKKLKSFSKSIILRKRCGTFTKNIKIMRQQIKIHGFDRLRRRWLGVTKFYSLRKYTKLD